MYYRIRFKGHLDQDWRHSFEGLQITHEIVGSTMLSGQLPDQAALYAVLLMIRRLGLTLLSLETEEVLSPARAEKQGETPGQADLAVWQNED